MLNQVEANIGCLVMSVGDGNGAKETLTTYVIRLDNVLNVTTPAFSLVVANHVC